MRHRLGVERGALSVWFSRHAEKPDSQSAVFHCFLRVIATSSRLVSAGYEARIKRGIANTIFTKAILQIGALSDG